MEKNRASTSTNISEQLKHEYYLRVFKYAFTEGKAHSFMAAYNKVNGIPCLVNPENVKIVKEQWGCEGYIVSDGDALPQLVTAHKLCETHAEAIALALKAGADNFPTQQNELVTEPAFDALEQGLITEADIDRAVGSMFKTRFRLGHFDPPEACPYSSIKKEQLCCEEHKAVAAEAARKSVVLLKNDGILPLDPDTCGKVLVLGDLAENTMPDWYSGKPPHKSPPLDAIREILPAKQIETVPMHDLCVIFDRQEGKWLRVGKDGSVTFDGTEVTRTVFEEIDWGFDSVSYRHSKTGKYLCVASDEENGGFKLACTSDAVWGWFTAELFMRSEETGGFLAHSFIFLNRYTTAESKAIDNLTKNLSREIVANAMVPVANAAKANDTVILVLGNHTLINGREAFDRPSIEFPKRWRELIDKISLVNKNLIVVFLSGYPYAFPVQENLMRAVLYASHGEQEVGNAVADALFGRFSPAGRLSQTWYRSDKDLPPMTNYNIIGSPRTYMYFRKPVQYPFGHGLSYTTFEYSELKAEDAVDGGVGAVDGGYSVSCKVTNTGDMDGDEVVQLYAAFGGVPVRKPLKKLVGFERVFIKKGETVTVNFDVPAEELRLYDESEAAFSIVPTRLTFMLGASSNDIRLELKI